jgi:hypothetical protein
VIAQARRKGWPPIEDGFIEDKPVRFCNPFIE